MDMAEQHSMGFRAGFLHIPYIPEQATRIGGVPSMSLDDIVRAIKRGEDKNQGYSKFCPPMPSGPMVSLALSSIGLPLMPSTIIEL